MAGVGLSEANNVEGAGAGGAEKQKEEQQEQPEEQVILG